MIDRAALAKAQAEMAAATEEFQDYDDPDRPEPAPEPEPVVEMKESDFADYAGDADSTVDITDDLKKN